jgi:hydroxyacylglutathione hydrolase
MFIKQFYTGCLSEAAYYIESEGEAIIIDPLRDIETYIQFAAERNTTIKYIFETHFHADFVSGHIDLSHKTGAPIVYGPMATTNYQIQSAKDGEIIPLGKINFEIVHTPGHTLESTCFLLRDEANQPYALFTGDTLFVGDVGRPDLSSGNMSSEELAAILFDSLNNKIKILPDHVLVYPAHGPGSSCGKNLGPNTHSTIGDEKLNNYAMRAESKEAFIKMVTEGLGATPAYFPVNAKINQAGYETVDKVTEAGTRKLSIEAFRQLIAEDCIILDSRNATVFTHGFIPGSISIGLEGRFAEWAGSILPFDKNIILVTEPGKEKETVIRLARVGFDKMKGCLDGGFDAWKNAGEAIDMIIDVEADELIMDMPHDANLVVVDVRKPNEFAEGHLKEAVNLPLQEMNNLIHLSQFEDHQNLYVHCAGGYRSVIATSLLKRQGIDNLRNVLGGWAAIKQIENVKIVKEETVLN